MSCRTSRLNPIVLAILVAGLAACPQGEVRASGQDADSVPVPAIGPALDAEALDALRGGQSVVVSSVHDDGEVNGNHADHIDSGMNSIDGGAFANASGITTVIQNSGSNVLIQNGNAVNVQFVDPTP